MSNLQALSDVVESVIGAIYISDHFSPVGAETFFDNVLKPFYDRHITLKTLSHHPTKILFELLQAHGCQSFGITKHKGAQQITSCDGKGRSFGRSLPRGTNHTGFQFLYMM